MPTHSGPNIVDNGLVLSLDAADNNSFRGEPTTNVAYNNNGTIDWTIGNLGGSSVSRSTVITNNVYRITSTIGSSFRMYFNLSKLVDGTTYTLSYNYKIISGGSTFSISDWNDTAVFNRVDTDYTNYSFSAASGTRASYTNVYRFMDFNISSNTIVEIWNVQLEAKPYATRFVNGTRGTTVATGGGWKDLSGNNNHGEIVNGVTTSNDQTPQGALEFDGVDDYIDLTLNNASGDWVHSIVFWMKLTDNQSNISTRVDPFQIGNSNLQSQYSAMDISNGNVNWYFYANDTRIQSNIFSANNWYHISLTYSGGGATISNKNIYINGLHRDWDITTGNNYGDSLNMAANAQMSIGRDGIRNTAYFPGYISLFKIYNRALTPQEIQQNYNSQKSRFGL